MPDQVSKNDDIDEVRMPDQLDLVDRLGPVRMPDQVSKNDDIDEGCMPDKASIVVRVNLEFGRARKVDRREHRSDGVTTQRGKESVQID